MSSSTMIDTTPQTTTSTTAPLPTPTGRIFLIRHCQSIHNSTRNFSLHDPGLSTHGETQALHLRFPHTSSIGLIITSPLKRAIQTTLLAFRHVLDEQYYAPQIRAKTVKGRLNAVRGRHGVKGGKRLGKEMQHTLRKLVCTPHTATPSALLAAPDPASRYLPEVETTLGTQPYHAGAIVPAGVENGIPLALEVDLQERSDAPCATGSSRARLEGEFPTLDFSNLGRRWNRKRGGQAASPEAIKARAGRIKRKLHQSLMELEREEVERKTLIDGGVRMLGPGEGVGKKDIAVVSHNVFMKVMLWDKDFRLGNGQYLCCRLVGDDDSLGGLKLVPVDEVTDEVVDLKELCGKNGLKRGVVNRDRSDDVNGVGLNAGENTADEERMNGLSEGGVPIRERIERKASLGVGDVHCYRRDFRNPVAVEV